MSESLSDDDLSTDSFVLLNLTSTSATNLADHVTCLLDLSDEILLHICRYLSPTHILYSFYTPEQPQLRLHRVICNYYNKIKFDQITTNEYNYLSSLLCYYEYPFRPQSLILSNEHVNYLIQRFLSDVSLNMELIFENLKQLKLIDCSEENLRTLRLDEINLSKIEDLHITIQKTDGQQNLTNFKDSYISLGEFLFKGQMSFLHTISIEINHGILLNTSLKAHGTLQNVNLFLQTIDDLYVLLDRLLSNVQTMNIHLMQPRLLTCGLPKRTSDRLQLTKFSLFEHCTGLVMYHLETIFGFMRNLVDLTLSIRDTPDQQFCHGSSFESILTEYFPLLRYFDYTMTHRIIDEKCFVDFNQWPMNNVFYENEGYKWIHIYSYPWPSNKNDQRELPLVQSGCYTTVKSNVKQSHYINPLLITKNK